MFRMETFFFLNDALTAQNDLSLILLCRMGKVTTDACMYCANLPDDARHTFLIRRWCLDRTSLESGEGDFVPESIISKILRSLGRA
jgi:hypothetical protein